MTSSKKALAVFLGILQGPQRSSLTLHSVVWKILVNAAISFPPRPDSGALELELELMKVIESPLTTSESGDVTTIDKPTDEMRRYIVDKFLAGWRFRLQIPARVATGSFDLTFLSLIPRVQQRLSNPADASDRKQLIQTSHTIVERAGFLIHSLPPERSSLVLDILYSSLSSEAFVVVSPDLQTLAHRIFMVLDCLRWYQHWIEDICPNMRFYSVAYQCYLYSPTGGDKRSEKDVMPHTLERLISYSFNLPYLSMHDFSSYLSDLSHYPLFSIDGLVQVMLLFISEHNQSILYKWARHPAMQNVWPECLSRLVRWASGEQFRRWTFLKRVLAIVVIGELQNMLGHSDDNESLPQYDYRAYTDVDQLPWLHEVGSSFRDGYPKYSQIAAHPKFQEFLYSRLGDVLVIDWLLLDCHVVWRLVVELDAAFQRVKWARKNKKAVWFAYGLALQDGADDSLNSSLVHVAGATYAGDNGEFRPMVTDGLGFQGRDGGRCSRGSARCMGGGPILIVALRVDSTSTSPTGDGSSIRQAATRAVFGTGELGTDKRMNGKRRAGETGGWGGNTTQMSQSTATDLGSFAAMDAYCADASEPSPCTCFLDDSHRSTLHHHAPQVRLVHRPLRLSSCHVFASRLLGLVRKATILTDLAKSGARLASSPPSSLTTSASPRIRGTVLPIGAF
ncbi:uncharacterized protein ARMOST_15940 [Armillaria ostoyae]|uniref:Uncharacterized protein n=1 Tax=Armillaria ostoyae TaxID=47428 RepID=A0A284RUT8_ARMOS|nr:uncharacterized protein ARMOST_15940 [Armillaria ostoyae]